MGRFQSDSGVKTLNPKVFGMRGLNARLVASSDALVTHLINWYIRSEYASRPFLWVEDAQTPIPLLMVADMGELNFAELDISRRDMLLRAEEQGGSLYKDE